MGFANRRPGVADLLYVMATELEYGAELRSRISPLICGVGPIEAAASVTERLTRLAVDDKLPLMVVLLGSSGSAELEQCGLYQASSVSWRDVDATALGSYRSGAGADGSLLVDVDIFPMRVEQQLDVWKEMDQRLRHWAVLPEAKRLLADPALNRLATALHNRLVPRQPIRLFSNR